MLESTVICGGFLFLLNKCRKMVEAVKKYIARQFERSFMLNRISSALIRLINVPGRVVGAFGLTWGAYVILIYLIKRYALYDTDQSFANLIVGIVAFIASIPILFSDKSICRMVKESWCLSAILNKIFGIPDESFKPCRIKNPGQSGAVILGILLGLATYLISPLDMVLGVISFVIIILLLLYPEGGVLISVAISPLLGLFEHSSIILAVFVLLTASSYFLKVLRGKRVFKVDRTSLAVFAFMLLILTSGFSPGNSNTLANAILCCSLCLIYPLVVNLLTNKQWINAGIVSFVLPSAVVAIVGFVQYAFGFSPTGWVDESLYPDILQRTVSVFDNPNVLGVYLAMMFPLSLMLTTSRFSRKIRILGGMCAVYIAIATLLTYSRSAWIALIGGALLFAVTVSPKGILWLIPAGSIIVALGFAFPDTVGLRLLNFISISDSANSYRIDVWNSSWELLSDTFLFGIGWGEEAFRTAYINYGADGTQYAMHSHSLYMQIVIQTGIIGLAVFGMCIYSVIRKCFSVSLGTKSDPLLSHIGNAAVSGAFAVMIAGIFDYTWYNFRIFFMFWALIALACAASNINKNELDMWSGQSDDNYSYITVSIPSGDDVHTDN